VVRHELRDRRPIGPVMAAIRLGEGRMHTVIARFSCAMLEGVANMQPLRASDDIKSPSNDVSRSSGGAAWACENSEWRSALGRVAGIRTRFSP
jgi:hypothetical protein